VIAATAALEDAPQPLLAADRAALDVTAGQVRRADRGAAVGTVSLHLSKVGRRGGACRVLQHFALVDRAS